MRVVSEVEKALKMPRVALEAISILCGVLTLVFLQLLAILVGMGAGCLGASLGQCEQEVHRPRLLAGTLEYYK